MKKLATLILFIAYMPLFFVGNKELIPILSNIYSVGVPLGLCVLYMHLYFNDFESYTLAFAVIFFTISASTFINKITPKDFSTYYPELLIVTSVGLFIVFNFITKKWKQKK